MKKLVAEPHRITIRTLVTMVAPPIVKGVVPTIERDGSIQIMQLCSESSIYAIIMHLDKM